MAAGNSVLVLQIQEGIETLKMQNFTDSTIPEILNGESGFHIYNVRMMTELILRQLREDQIYSFLDEEVEAIVLASCLHDIGKSRIPKSILNYPGKLSFEKYDIIKQHVVLGENIIRELDFGVIGLKVKQYAMEIARAHHERYDGTGYPDGLKGEEIPVSAQIVALADAYDALVSNRSYKEAFSPDVAYQMISSGGCGSFNESLLNCLGEIVNHNRVVC